MALNTKWAAEYQESTGKAEKQERWKEQKAGQKDISKISELKRELDDLKIERDRNKDSR